MALCDSWAGKGGVCKGLVSVGPLISQSLGCSSIPELQRKGARKPMASDPQVGGREA